MLCGLKKKCYRLQGTNLVFNLSAGLDCWIDSQVGSSDENELILTHVLDALHETLCILLRTQVCYLPLQLGYSPV